MKRYFLLLLVPLFVVSCGKKNPIVFQKKSDMAEITLSLDTNGTFDYKANSPIGAAFHETGTYTIEDSLLILRFKYESYDHLCYTIPLPNDTTLIMNYKGKTLLYPMIKDIPEFKLHYDSNEQLMEQVVSVYQREDFADQVGVRYFSLKSGDLSLIFNGKWKISPYYDSQIEK